MAPIMDLRTVSIRAEAWGDSNYIEEGTSILGVLGRFCIVSKTENLYIC